MARSRFPASAPPRQQDATQRSSFRHAARSGTRHGVRSATLIPGVQGAADGPGDFHPGPFGRGSGLRAWPPAFQARKFVGVPAVDMDPETYIHQAGQQLRPPAAGSLNVGSLTGG